jgi:hypothetical protein
MTAQTQPTLPESQLARNARDYLRRNRGRLPAIAAETGVGHQWALKFANGKIADPGVARVEAVLRHGGLLPTTDCRTAAAP